MKKYIAVIISLILTMGLIPVAVNSRIFADSFSKKSEQAVSSSIIFSGKETGYNMPENLTFIDRRTDKRSSRSSKSLIYSLVGASVNDDFEENEVKALAIAFHTQLCHENDSQTLSIDTKNTDIFLNENQLKNKFGKNYTTLCSYCDNVYSSLILTSQKPANLNIDYLSSNPETNLSVTIKADPYSSLAADYSTVISVSKDDFFKTLKNLNPDIITDITPQSAVGDITYLDAGDVDKANICGSEFSGSELVKAFSLPYNRFTLIYSLNEFCFTVQRCDAENRLTPNIAHFMSIQGNTYSEILSYCYSFL